jgi:hypothetical protein
VAAAAAAAGGDFADIDGRERFLADAGREQGLRLPLLLPRLVLVLVLVLVLLRAARCVVGGVAAVAEVAVRLHRAIVQLQAVRSAAAAALVGRHPPPGADTRSR